MIILVLECDISLWIVVVNKICTHVKKYDLTFSLAA
jgi:hypothetical protein